MAQLSSRKFLVPVVFIIALLASCTAAPGTSSQAPSTGQPSSQVAQKLTIVVGSEPSTLDGLHESGNAVFSTVTQNIMETLTVIDTETRKVVPVLATAWTQANPSTWQITIRSGVKFHDGAAMTTDDVVASLNYVAAEGSPFRTYLPAGIQASKRDATTVEITTTQPAPLLPIQLQFVSVAPAAAIAKGKDFMATQGVGTGPYKLVAWTKGQSLTLTRFDGYWGARPPIQDVTYLWRSEPSVRSDMLRAGEAQMANALSPSTVPSLPTVATVASLSVYTLFLNTTGQTKGSIMSDERVRMALNYAIDRKALADQIYGGYASLAHGNIVAPAVLGYNDQVDDYPYDVQKATDLIKQAGASGKEVSFLCPNSNFINVVEACQFITAQLSRIGLNVKLSSVPFAVWLDTFRNGPKGLDRPDILISTPTEETLDMASKIAATLLYPSASGGTATIDDPQLTALVKQALAEADQTKRQAVEEQMSKYVHDHAFFVPLLRPQEIWGLSKGVDFKPLPNQSLYLSKIRLSN